MRVLHVITNLNIGGAEKLLVDLLPLLKKRIPVELALFVGNRTPFYEAIEKSGVRINIFNKRGSVYSLSNIIHLFRLSKHFDAVHTHNTAPQLYGAFVSLFVSFKLFTTEHTTTNNHRVWWFRPIEKWMYSRYDKIVCISEATRESVCSISKTNNAKTIVIPNGICLNVYKNAMPVDKKELKTGLDTFIMLRVGRFSYQKDQETIIRSMEYLPANIELWLAGYGERQKELELVAQELNVFDRVHFIGMRNDVPNLLKTCDVVIQSSHIEGFGLAAVEGMAAGKPVVASDIPGLSQVVKGAGILFPHGNSKKLAEIIIKLSADKLYYEIIANRCSERSNTYDISHMTRDYELLYRDTLG